MSELESYSFYFPDQEKYFHTDHLLLNDVCVFDPSKVNEILQAPQEIVAMDIGGDKIRNATYTIQNGELIKQDEKIFRSMDGSGYLPYIEEVANNVLREGKKVGISSAGKFEGTVMQRATNLGTFLHEFEDKYDADYSLLFQDSVFVANDTVTGIIGASSYLARQDVENLSLVFAISASGVGASVLKDTKVINAEIGHVPVVPELNPLHQTIPCGLPNKDYVCLERVASARSGMEVIYERSTGEKIDGRELGICYENGDTIATTLYESSACLLAHAVSGVTTRFDITHPSESYVVFHGGNFEVEKYRRSVKEKLEVMPNHPGNIIFSRDVASNICMDGAAIAAAYYL